MSLAFLPSSKDLPLPGDRDQAALRFEEFYDRLARVDDPMVRESLESLTANPDGTALLTVIFSQSSFLAHCVISDLAFFSALLKEGPDASLSGVLSQVRVHLAAENDKAAVWRGLRQAKKRAALLIGLADMAGHWNVEKTTLALSDFADAAMDCALSFLLRQAAARGDLALADAEDPLADCGYVLIAMGKLGARELNYSSDIDIIPLYDPAKIDYRHDRGVAEGMVRLTRDLVALLEERTGEGYVFRTDLRLRPDPGATPLANSIGGALTYYESLGQNWERAAMIKARAAAGDKAAGNYFLKELRPFVWRKHLDFWAIQDVHSIKRQINAHKGGSVVAVEGHDIKVGRGGIREIEFFAQTQQLIFGGREPELRTPRTLEALSALAASGRVSNEDRDVLGESYRFLRTLEHRLQMVADKQTQKLPQTLEELDLIARFMGFADTEIFREKVLSVLRQVEDRYAHLFEEAPTLSAGGNLVFTGGEPESGTLETLAAMGFADGTLVFNLVRAWHHGRYRATRSTRARELLTEIMPSLLEALGKTANPDSALTRFDAFLQGLPEGVQLFSLLYQNPNLLELIADIMGGAPALAEQLSRNSGLLEAVLSPDFFDPLPELGDLEKELQSRLVQARDYQDVLDITRRWANDRRFQVGVQILRGIAEVDETGKQLSDIAEVSLGALLGPTQEELARNHGHLPSPGLAVIALGKLGTREMTFTSDLDLVFLYEPAGDSTESDGAKPLSPSVYFGRLAQRLITAVSSATGEGRLYEVDPRLRPSGSSGPIATSLKGFEDYEREKAWTWEHMALTRARVVAAEPGFAARIEGAIHDILTQSHASDRVLIDAAEMRRRLAKEFQPQGPWDVKHLPGGLLDLDFAAQVLLLCHAREHRGLLQRSSQAIFSAAGEAGLLTADKAEVLIHALRLMRRIQGFLRLTIGKRFDETAAPASVLSGLARTTGRPDFKSVKEDLNRYLEAGSHAFAEIVGEPARRAASEREADGAPPA